MATFQVNTDRKQISIILNLIRIDCIDLNKIFGKIKPQLKQAIERFEEFMTTEINDTLFQHNNNFSDIVLSHRAKFSKFIEETSKVIHDNGAFAPHQPTITQNGASHDNSINVIFVALQHWLVQGPKGQHLCFMIDIDTFNYTQYSEFQNFAISKKVVLIFRIIIHKNVDFFMFTSVCFFFGSHSRSII